MQQIILWALGTGAITGGVWVAIVLLGRQRVIRDRERAMIEDVARRSVLLEQVEQRLAEVEERLDFAERLLRQQQPSERLLPPTDQIPSQPGDRPGRELG